MQLPKHLFAVSLTVTYKRQSYGHPDHKQREIQDIKSQESLALASEAPRMKFSSERLMVTIVKFVSIGV